MTGIVIYATLMYASTFYESKTVPEIITRLSATIYGTYSYT